MSRTRFTQSLSCIPVWIPQQKVTTCENAHKFRFKIFKGKTSNRPHLCSSLGAGSAGRIQFGSRPGFRSGIGFGAGVRLAPWLLLRGGRRYQHLVSKQWAKVGTENANFADYFRIRLLELQKQNRWNVIESWYSSLLKHDPGHSFLVQTHHVGWSRF